MWSGCLVGRAFRRAPMRECCCAFDRRHLAIFFARSMLSSCPSIKNLGGVIQFHRLHEKILDVTSAAFLACQLLASTIAKYCCWRSGEKYAVAVDVKSALRIGRRCTLHSAACPSSAKVVLGIAHLFLYVPGSEKSPRAYAGERCWERSSLDFRLPNCGRGK